MWIQRLISFQHPSINFESVIHQTIELLQKQMICLDLYLKKGRNFKKKYQMLIIDKQKWLTFILTSEITLVWFLLNLHES